MLHLRGLWLFHPPFQNSSPTCSSADARKLQAFAGIFADICRHAGRTQDMHRPEAAQARHNFGSDSLIVSGRCLSFSHFP